VLVVVLRRDLVRAQALVGRLALALVFLFEIVVAPLLASL
jgi:hypothetical protein